VGLELQEELGVAVALVLGLLDYLKGEWEKGTCLELLSRRLLVDLVLDSWVES
jgi:hypothetical protein